MVRVVVVIAPMSMGSSAGQLKLVSPLPATGVGEMLDGLKMMTSLKKVRLRSRDPYQWIDPNKAWDTFFSNYHHLTEVSICGNQKAINFDEGVRNLVLCNPHLKIFELQAFWVTNTALTHLAKLRNLVKVILTHNSNPVTSNGILTLIRGSSRKVIREIQVHHNQFMIPAAVFHAELMLMAQVTGELLDVQSGCRSIKIGSLISA